MSLSSINFAARSLRQRLPKLCLSITAKDASEMEHKAEEALRESSFLELRLDHLKSPQAGISKIRKIMDLRPDAILMATCRRKAGGGEFAGTVAEQLELLAKATHAGCQLVDVEIESASSMSPEEFQRYRERLPSLLISSHDFHQTAALDEKLTAMRAYEADFYKIIATATSLHDNVAMLKFLERASEDHFVIGHCMGERGVPSRVLSLRYGSVFTFAALSAADATGPGQLSLREMRDLYRIESIDVVTKIYGVVGDPVEHSLTPFTMNAAFRRENVNAVMLRLHAEKIEDLLACISEIPLSGLAVTMPFKQAIVEKLSNSDPWTQKTGACNTVVRSQDGRLFGFNTDVAGILTPLESLLSLKGVRALILGAGGAARAALFALKERGAEIAIYNRTMSKAISLAAEVGARAIERADLQREEFDIVLNATPLGMGKDATSPLKNNELHARVVFDMVYNPYWTPLLKQAKQLGVATINGCEMFVHQGARQFEIFTGAPAPVVEMRQELYQQLNITAADLTPSARLAPPPAPVEKAAEAKPEVKAEKPAPKHKPVAKKTEAPPAAKAPVVAKTAPKKAEAAPAKAPVAKPAPVKSAPAAKTSVKAVAKAAPIVKKAEKKAPASAKAVAPSKVVKASKPVAKPIAKAKPVVKAKPAPKAAKKPAAKSGKK